MTLKKIKALFTRRETQVAYLVSQGLENKEIGKVLGLHPTTIALYIHQILGKIHLRNRTELAVAIVESGMKKPSMRKPAKKARGAAK